MYQTLLYWDERLDRWYNAYQTKPVEVDTEVEGWPRWRSLPRKIAIESLSLIKDIHRDIQVVNE